jgi:hypothetical protein
VEDLTVMHSPLLNYLMYGSDKAYPLITELPTSKVMPYMYNRVTRFRENMHYKGIFKDYLA